MSHAHSFTNRDALGRAELAGCYYCIEIFRPDEITEWVDGGETAVCPRCGVDSVVPLPPGEDPRPWLQELHQQWFAVDLSALYSL